MNPREWAAATLALTPAELIPTPRSVLEALATAEAPAEAPPDHGSGPGGDFTATDLRSRYHRSASWVRERLAAGEFGRPYRIGRDQVAKRANVLAYDARLRGEEEEGAAPPPPPRPSRGLSLVERRRGSTA